MKFYSIDVEQELSQESLEIPADLLGHHFRLRCACALLEAFGGLIRDCRRWSQRRWQALAGVSKRTLRRLERSRLAHWEGDHLRVERFNDYGILKLQQRRLDARKAIESRWLRAKSRITTGTTKDRSSPGDPGGDRSPRHAKAAASSSSIEVVEASGGGGLPDGTWEEIWAALPNRRAYWQRRARQALEAVVVPDEVVDFLDWLGSQKRTRSWQKSPPTPLMIANDYGDRRRRAPDAGTRRRRSTDPDRTRLPSREDIRASWADVTNRSRGKETPT